MKNKKIKNYKLLFCLTVVLFLAGAGPLFADSLGDLVQGMEGYDIYEALAKSEWPPPTPRMSNKDLYKISEYVAGQGYKYFSVSPGPLKDESSLRPDMWQFFLDGKEVVILATDVIPKNSRLYVWDAGRVYRRARFRLGYHNERKRALRKSEEELARNPGDIRALSNKAAVLSEIAKFEGGKLADYFDALKQLIQARLKRGDVLNLDADLIPFMNVAICSGRESEYLDAITLMPSEQAETKKLARKKYDNKRLSFSDPDEKRELCRGYGS